MELSWVSLVLCLLLTLRAEVKAVASCDENIVQYILDHNNCPTNIFNGVITDNDTLTYAVYPSDEVPPSLECISIVLEDSPSYNTITTVYYNDGRDPTETRFTVQEGECGHITKYDKTGTQYELYVLDFKYAACHYFCLSAPGKQGPPSGACTVPVSKRNDPSVLAELRTNRERLESAGVTDLVQVPTCCPTWLKLMQTYG